MKLVSLRLPLDNLPDAFNYVREVNFAEPKQATYGWRVLIHGQVVTVIVPTVHEQVQGGRRPDQAGAYTFARARCSEQWDSRSPEDYKKPVQDYESEPCGPRAVTPTDEPKAVA
jgi:hypothetical protein